MKPDPASPRVEGTDAARDSLGLTDVRARPPERVPIRTRTSGATTSGWRFEVECGQGTGAVVLVESSPQESYYRGEGLFLGWPQERLAAVHDALGPRSEEPGFDLPQLG